MGGIFGGLLAVIQFLGGLFLFILVGSRAWNPTDTGEVLRTFFGGAVLGLLVGIGLHRFVLLEDGMALWLVLVISTVGGVILGLILYTIYDELTGESAKKIRVYYRTTIEEVRTKKRPPTQE